MIVSALSRAVSWIFSGPANWARRTLQGRLVASFVIGGATGLAIMATILHTVFVNNIESAFDERLGLSIDSLLISAELDRDGELSVSYLGNEPRFDRTFSGWYWQVTPLGTPLGTPFETSTEIPPDELTGTSDGSSDVKAGDTGTNGTKRSHSLGDWNLNVPASPMRGERVSGIVYGPLSQKLRYVSNDIALGQDENLYRFTVAADYGEVEQRTRNFFGAMAVGLLVMGLALSAVLFLQVRFAAGPMNRLRMALGAVRSGQAPRMEGAFLREVEPLVSELNAMLDHNDEVVERARTQVGNLAHGLKTPLSVLKNEAGAGDGPLAETVARETDAMRRQIDHYLARARAAAAVNVLGARSDVHARISAFARTMEKIYADKSVSLNWSCPEDLIFRGETHDLDELLGNLIDNAFKWAQADVRVVAVRAGAQMTVTVEDDGPGLSDDEIKHVLVRGGRLDESMPGSGLGLAIVGDIAELYKGGLDLSRSDLGGLKAVLSLPAA